MQRTNYHTHTARCFHATGSDEEYVLNAIKGGYTELGFSDHCPWPFSSGYVSGIRMDAETLPEYVESIRTLRDKYKDQIKIYIGLECEFFPRYMEWLKAQIDLYELDYVIFGNHFPYSEEEYPYFGRYTTTVDMLNLYSESAIEGMKSGLFKYLAHPDLFMRSYPSFDKHCEKISREICRTAYRLHLPLEYNFSYVKENEQKGITTFPHPKFWQIAAEEQCSAIIGVDAHEADRLQDPYYYDLSVQQLGKLGIRRIEHLF